MQSKQIRRRRAVLALLVAISLILLTAAFGDSSGSPLHPVQQGVVEVLSPVQAGASRVLSPVRDIAGWFSSTINAKSEVAQLKDQNALLTKKYDRAQYRGVLSAQAQKLVDLDSSADLSAYSPLGAHVIAMDPSVWYDQIEVDSGTDDGVHANDPVIGDGGLVGVVSSHVGPSYAWVTLITNQKFAVGAMVLEGSGSENSGVLQPAVGSQNTMDLEDLPATAQISQGQEVVTSGFKDPNNSAIKSLYPADIPIGTVSNANTGDTLANDQEVQVAPLVDVRHLTLVQILRTPQASTNVSAALP